MAELSPLLAALDLMVQDAADDGQGLQIRPRDYPALSVTQYDAMVEDLRTVAKGLRVIAAHRPCLIRALRLWAGR